MTTFILPYYNLLAHGLRYSAKYLLSKSIVPPQGFEPRFAYTDYSLAHLMPIDVCRRRRSTPAALGVMAWLRIKDIRLPCEVRNLEKNPNEPRIYDKHLYSVIHGHHFFFLLEEVVVFFFFEPEPHPAISHTSFLSAN